MTDWSLKGWGSENGIKAHILECPAVVPWVRSPIFWSQTNCCLEDLSVHHVCHHPKETWTIKTRKQRSYSRSQSSVLQPCVGKEALPLQWFQACSNTLTWQHRGDSSKGVELQSTYRIASMQHFHHQEDETDEQQADVQHLRSQRQPQDSCQEPETSHISTGWLVQGRVLPPPNPILKGCPLERRERRKTTNTQRKKMTFNLGLSWWSKELNGASIAAAGTWPPEFRKTLASLYFSLKPQLRLNYILWGRYQARAITFTTHPILNRVQVLSWWDYEWDLSDTTAELTVQ